VSDWSSDVCSSDLTSRFARRVLHVLPATLYRSARDYRRTVPVDPTWQECSLFPPPPPGVSRYHGRREEAPNPSPRGCQKRWPPESASYLCRPLFSGALESRTTSAVSTFRPGLASSSSPHRLPLNRCA